MPQFDTTQELPRPEALSYRDLHPEELTQKEQSALDKFLKNLSAIMFESDNAQD